MVLLAGCQSILGIEEGVLAEHAGGAAGAAGEPGSCTPPPEAAAGGAALSGLSLGWWSGCDSSDRCYSVGLPSQEDRPTDVASSDDVPRFFVAIRSMRLGSRNEAGELDEQAWRGLGLDLDGLCTSSSTCNLPGEPEMACSPHSSQTPDDGTYCRDNQVGRLDYTLDTLPLTAGVYMVTEPQFNCSLCQGAYNIIFAVSSYNGLPEDDSVRVDIYPSPGIAELKPIDCSSSEWDGSGSCWTRDDVWGIQSSHVENTQPGPDPGPATYYDPAAFVRDGVIVAALPENTPIWFPGDRAVNTVVPMVLHGGILIGRLAERTGEWEVTDGTLAGRTRKSDLIEGFGMLGVCEGEPAFTVIQSFVDTSADLMSTGAVAPDTPCDALSVGFGFTASEATVGPLVDVTELTPCEPG